MTTGERIKQRRKELGITADSLAEKIGVSRSTMFRYENGDIEKLPMTILGPISRALRTSPGYLMGWNDYPDDTTYLSLQEFEDMINEPATEAGDGLEAEVIHLFEGLPPEKRQAAAEYLRFLAGRADK